MATEETIIQDWQLVPEPLAEINGLRTQLLAEQNRTKALELALREIAAMDEVSITDFDLDMNQWRHQAIARATLKQD